MATPTIRIQPKNIDEYQRSDVPGAPPTQAYVQEHHTCTTDDASHATGAEPDRSWRKITDLISTSKHTIGDPRTTSAEGVEAVERFDRQITVIKGIAGTRIRIDVGVLAYEEGKTGSRELYKREWAAEVEIPRELLGHTEGSQQRVALEAGGSASVRQESSRESKCPFLEESDGEDTASLSGENQDAPSEEM
ncbi:hypothetical protein Tdes44962_MAKER08096 [Teratosphaeria destructans]|uniref:Uncharacterized protein n=1 Tax=Teratosphaeria destructans TaxID=418781 RepID=A0A9W7SXJ8_9PEZI|nr:hypothetical protein Tdes44962_MAKER08096 [Teratosphaeria destructans]